MVGRRQRERVDVDELEGREAAGPALPAQLTHRLCHSGRLTEGRRGRGRREGTGENEGKCEGKKMGKYCNTVNGELTGMKKRIATREISMLMS